MRPVAQSRFFLFLLLLLSSSAWGQPQVEVFQLENRPASELLGQLQALYPGDEVIFSADGQQLMVKADAQVTREVEALLTRLDVAPAQMRITLRRQTGRTGGGSPGTRHSTRTGQSQQSVVVQSGETARIASGQIRRVTRAVAGGEHISLIAEDTPMESGFLVQPRALGSTQVELRVVSFNDTPAGPAGSDRETAALVTMRRAAPGEWVSLGTEGEQSGEQQGLSSRSTRDRHQDWAIKVEFIP